MKPKSEWAFVFALTVAGLSGVAICQEGGGGLQPGKSASEQAEEEATGYEGVNDLAEEHYQENPNESTKENKEAWETLSREQERECRLLEA